MSSYVLIKDYFFLRKGAVLKRSADGFYYISMPDPAWLKSHIGGAPVIDKMVVENSHDLFKKITADEEKKLRFELYGPDYLDDDDSDHVPLLCPYCGAQAEVEWHMSFIGTQRKKTYFMSCMSCTAASGSFDSPDEAVCAWNKNREPKRKDKWTFNRRWTRTTKK